MGFQVAKGCYLTALEPRTAREQKKITQKIKKASRRFYKELQRPIPTPSFFKLMVFRMSRTGIKAILNEKDRDYRYFKEKGWFESDYYYDVALGFIKKPAGQLLDFLGERMVKNR